VEAAQRAKQDLGDEDTANGPAGAGPKGFEPPPFPSGGGLPEPVKPDWMTNAPAWLSQGPPKLPEAPRQTKLEAEGMFDNLKRGIDFLTNKSIDSRTKLNLLGEAVKEALGWKTWWDALAPEQTREKIKQGWMRVIGGVSDTWNSIKASWDEFFTKLGNRWRDFKIGVAESWNGFWSDVGAKWDTFKTGFKKGWDQYWDSFLAPFYAMVGLAYVIWVSFSEEWSKFWTGIKSWWTENVSTPFSAAWNTFWSGLTSWWNTNVRDPFTNGWNSFWTGLTSWWNGNVKEPFTTNWNTFWSGITNWWNGNVKEPFTKAWNEFWTGAQQRWDAFKKDVSEAWNKLWTDLITSWNTFWQGVKRDWDKLWTDLGTTWTTFKDGFKTKWDELWASLGKAWSDFWSPIAKDWDSLISKIGEVFGKITGFFSDLQTTINRLISIGKRLLSLGGGGGGDNGEAPGYEDGLYQVPYDNYRARLHQGERVLTKGEAALYNSVEKMGVLGLLSAMATGATNRLAAATAPQNQQVVNTTNTTIYEGERKSVEVHVDRIDATNPDEGRAFAQKLAFLMG
jgi:hypothetical protein